MDELDPKEVLDLYPANERTIGGFLASRLEKKPHHPFLEFKDRTTSYRDFEALVVLAASMFQDKGVSAGDRVAIMASNSDHFVVAFFALARLSAIMVPINPAFGIDETRYVAEHADICGIICESKIANVAKSACVNLDNWLMAIDEEDPTLESFSELLKSTPAKKIERVAKPEDICVIIYTSGTTGFPKGVMHSHENMIMTGEAFVDRMSLQPEERVLCILPFFHINGLMYSLFGTLAAGATLITTKKFSASKFWNLVAETKATEVNLIAAIGSILIKRPRKEFVADHCLEKVYGSPIPKDVEEAFQNDFGVKKLIEGYGMTEVPGAINTPFYGEQRELSMGKAAKHPNMDTFAELRVVDEDGKEVAPDTPGELQVKIPIVMQGYFKDEQQTKDVFDGDWFKTGDYVTYDKDNYYYFISRKNDIIRKGGENISGAEIDRILQEHEDIIEGAAIAVPSELGEDEILVAIVCKQDKTLKASDITTWCESKLAKHKVPRYVLFAESLPRTPTHRVAKYKLKQDESLLKKAIDTK